MLTIHDAWLFDCTFSTVGIWLHTQLTKILLNKSSGEVQTNWEHETEKVFEIGAGDDLNKN